MITTNDLHQSPIITDFKSIIAVAQQTDAEASLITVTNILASIKTRAKMNILNANKLNNFITNE